jgi:hypothetical protein
MTNDGVGFESDRIRHSLLATSFAITAENLHEGGLQRFISGWHSSTLAVLECSSPPQLFTGQETLESAGGPAHSKTLSRPASSREHSMFRDLQTPQIVIDE